MRIVIAAVGRVRDKPLRAAIDEYVKRVSRYVACDEVEVPDGPSAKVDAALAKSFTDATVVALDVDGEALDSPAFARAVERWGSRGKGIVTFVIGGADGISDVTRARAHARVSLSALTFPHRLARLVLVEQLYRAFTILRGEPYAH